MSGNPDILRAPLCLGLVLSAPSRLLLPDRSTLFWELHGLEPRRGRVGTAPKGSLGLREQGQLGGGGGGEQSAKWKYHGLLFLRKT